MPEEAHMITTLSGNNSFALKRELDKRVTEFVGKHGDMALERVDGEEAEFNRLTEALQSLPFLATNKLVVLRAPGANKQFAEKFEDLLPTIPETTEVMLVEPKLDKRTQYYKTLKKQTELKEFSELDAAQLAKWLVDEAKERKGSMSFGDANYLVERVGTDQYMLHNELAKLLDYDPKITRQTINLLTEPSPQSTIFELIDAAFNGRTKRAIELYEEQRKLKVEPQQIIAMLAWQLQTMALLKAAGNRPAEQIARDAKLNPFVVRKNLPLVRRLTMAELKDLVSRVLDLDIKLKSQSIDADDALQHLLLTISS
jgi:DNA polymerase-3 subunit delta